MYKFQENNKRPLVDNKLWLAIYILCLIIILFSLSYPNIIIGGF